MRIVFIDKKVYALAPKKELVCVLPFIREKSLQLRSKLVKSVKNNLSFCHLLVAFQSSYKLCTLFRFKGTIDKKICSDLFYRYLCNSNNATYYGRTYRHFFTRAAEQISISNLAVKRVENVNESAVSDRLLQCDCKFHFDHFDILASGTNSFRLFIKKSLLIKRDKPVLSRTVKHFSLKYLTNLYRFHSLYHSIRIV